MNEKPVDLFRRLLHSPTTPETYYRFLLEKGLTIDKPGLGILDPFTPYLDPSISNPYFPRGVESWVALWTHQIITGRPYAGKTMVMERTAKAMRTFDESTGVNSDTRAEENLIVIIPLSNSWEIIEDEVFIRRGANSPLALFPLGRCIFSAYYEQYIAKVGATEGTLGLYRRNREWMEQLRWLYHHYSPRRPGLEDNFELRTWLEADCPKRPDWPSTDIESLHYLMNFITRPVPDLLPKNEKVAQFHRVLVMVDETEQITEAAVTCLLDDFEKLINLHIQRLSVKLFLDDRQADALAHLGCLLSGQVSLVSMPVWTENHIRTLLISRPLLYTGIDLALEKLDPVQGLADNRNHNWTWKLVENHIITNPVRVHLFKKLVSTPYQLCAAHLSDSAQPHSINSYEAPYHTLRLTKTVLALFAEIGAISTATTGGDDNGINDGDIDGICTAYIECARQGQGGQNG